ncbi:MAG TPA: nuclear transport factor 2 family protein [Acidimicrobiales bacterium]|nr:nuclear transport factor 2 family protein [Acidimicrobiales bacterium]
MPVVRRDWVLRWLALYENAWRTPGTVALAELFTPTVTYLASPWSEPVRGLDELALMWEAERADGEEFTMSSEVLAVDADTAVVRVDVDYERPEPSLWRNLWVVRFAAGGRCAAFEEWPFAPGQYDGHAAPEEPAR